MFHLQVAESVATVVMDRPPTTAVVARRYAAVPVHAVKAAKACIATASNPFVGGFNEEVEQTRGLFRSDRTRELIGAFLAGTNR